MTPLVECRGVTRAYPGGVFAVAELDMSIFPGEYVALMGPSGSGKTTLSNLIGLLDTPTSGSVRIEGEDTSRWSDRERSERRSSMISYVFQSFHLLPDRTVRENVETGLIHQRVPRARRHDAVSRAIESVGLAERAGAVARTLSGGEQQRTAVARALVRKPRLLICDEPVGNLDEENARNVLDMIDDAHRSGVTVALVTHDSVAAQRAERVVRLARGRLEGAADRPGS